MCLWFTTHKISCHWIGWNLSRAARLGSLSAAAKEAGIAYGAISRQFSRLLFSVRRASDRSRGATRQRGKITVADSLAELSEPVIVGAPRRCGCPERPDHRALGRSSQIAPFVTKRQPLPDIRFPKAAVIAMIGPKQTTASIFSFASAAIKLANATRRAYWSTTEPSTCKRV